MKNIFLFVRVCDIMGEIVNKITKFIRRVSNVSFSKRHA